MLSRRIVTPVGIAAALVGLVAVAAATTPSGSDNESDSDASRVPVATASGGGGGAPLIYPSIVGVRLDRAHAALARAGTRVDQGKPQGAVTEVKAAQGQTTAAWAATKYVIKTTPPPPPPVGDRAQGSGGAPAGGAFASPPETGLAVLSLQHDVISTSVGLVGTPNAALSDTVSTTIRATATARDKAIAYIHKVAPPPPPPGDRAGASGAAVAVSWDTTMPSVLPLLDDEIQALKGTLALNKGLPANVTTAVKAVVAQDRKTKDTINKFWPPVVGDD